MQMPRAVMLRPPMANAAARARDPLNSLPRADRHVPKCGPLAKSRVSRWRAMVLIAVHVAIGAHFWHWFATGESLSPVEPSEAMQTVELGKINAGFVLFLLLIGSTLVFGRFFCGWLCHVVALQDFCAWLLAKVGWKPRPLRSRLLVLAPWAVAFAMFGMPLLEQSLGHRQLPAPNTWQWELTSRDLWQTFPGPVMALLTVGVAGFLMVWWLGAKGFCTHGCPYGAFFAVADRVAPTRIKVSPACDGCGHCTAVCSSNVRVHEEVHRHGQIVDPGCMKCLDCVSVCPKDALHVGFAVPKPLVLSQQRSKARADFTWPEEFALAAIALVATQWTFRGAWFGERVPFLLAVGLGVLTAVFALLLWRLLTRAELTFQHTQLKAAGRCTRTGRKTLLLLCAWVALAGHLFVGQRLAQHGRSVAGPLLQGWLNERVPIAPDDLLVAEDAVDDALAWGLCGDPELLQMRGLLRREQNRHAEAEGDFVAALAKAPKMEYAAIGLAVYRLRAGDLTTAERLAREVLAYSKANKTAAALLEQVEKRR